MIKPKIIFDFIAAILIFSPIVAVASLVYHVNLVGSGNNRDVIITIASSFSFFLISMFWLIIRYAKAINRKLPIIQNPWFIATVFVAGLLIKFGISAVYYLSHRFGV